MNFWQKLLGGTQGTGHPVEDEFDPTSLLKQAQREMEELHARNRDVAVRAITEKNNLEQMVQDIERKIRLLQEKADLAEERGDTDLAKQLRFEATSYTMTLTEIHASWEEAKLKADRIKATIKSEEERIRQKTTEAMLLETQWHTMQLQRSLFASLIEVNTGAAQNVPTSERTVRHALNRRFVRQAVVQRDNLRQMQADTEKRVALLRENSKQARTRDNDDLENALLREMEQYEAMLVQTRDATQQAEEVTERAIALLKDEEESLRAQGLDPLIVSDEQIALYEAQAALADAETTRDKRHNKQRGSMALITLLVILAIIVLLVALL
ncbi:MAG: PspA/IM30 family protein [Akkermansiaceae bacterium]|nr:PspA/IM30 family protein [Armatimonadota bacterium]